MPAGKKEDDLASHIIAQMDASRITRNDDNDDEDVQQLSSPPRHQEMSASLRNVFSDFRSMSTLETLRDMRQSPAKCLSVINPYEFYILLDCMKDQQRQLDDLMKASFSKEYLVHPMQLKENDNVIVWSTQFTCFARGRFVAYEKKHKLSSRSTRNCIAEQAKSFCVRVYLIDYGFTEVLYLANVRSIDDGTGIFNFSVYPILHVKCSLVGVKPPSPPGNWSSSAIALMRELIEGKPVHVTFACKQNQIAYVSCEYLVSKVNYIRGGLLDHALVYSGHAVFQGLGSNDDGLTTYYNNAIFKNENLPSQGHVITGVVSHIDNPDLFYINKASQQDDMLNMQKDLQRFYSSQEAKKLIIFHPRPGLVCVAKFADDGQFYRAHIDKLNVKKKVALIQYIDYGNRAEIDLQSEPIYYVTDDFFRYPVFAIRCCMGEIEPLNTAKWSDNATNCFRTFVQENPESTSFLVSVKVIRSQRESHRLEVSLTKWTGEGQSTSVADQMITKKFAKKKVVVEGQVDVNVSRLIEEFKDINVNSFQILRETQERNVLAELPATHSLIPVKVFNAESPLSFYLQLAIENVQALYKHMRDNLNNIMEVAAVPENSGANVPFHMNEKVVFRFREKWFRGEYFGAVEELQDNETNSQSEDKPKNREESTEKQKKFIILDIDGGYKFNGKLLPAIPASEVFKLPVQFLKDDPYSIHCSLGDISPAGGSQWSKRAMELFGKFILDNPFEEESRVYLHLKEVVPKERPAESLRVNLVKIIKIDQGPFFPRKKVYQCLSEHLVEEGVALEIRNRAGSDQGSTDQEILNNPLANLKAPKKTRAPNDRDGTLVSMLLRFQENQPDATDENFIHSRHEDPSQEFAAVVTNIGSDGEIYFRLTSDNQLISEINTEIVRELNQRKLPPIDITTIMENRACTARFAFDDTWNRAKIIGLSSKKEHHIRIYFVDYGQLEEVLIEDIAGYVFCRHIPELAIRAKLYGIKIPSDLKPAAVDELYKLLVDKNVNVVWKNKPERSPMMVSMTIDLMEHDDIMDVADWLLNKDLAIPFIDE